MGPMRHEASVTVQRPIEEVWAFMTDTRNLPGWGPAWPEHWCSIAATRIRYAVPILISGPVRVTGRDCARNATTRAKNDETAFDSAVPGPLGPRLPERGVAITEPAGHRWLECLP